MVHSLVCGCPFRRHRASKSPPIPTVVPALLAASPSPLRCPTGGVDALLETYDRDRKALPPPVLMWAWGWTRSAETWNGRIAMLALVLILLLEGTTGRGVVNNLLAVHHVLPAAAPVLAPSS